MLDVLRRTLWVVSAKRGTAELAADRRFDFAALARRCRTQNEFNRLSINLENVITPVEIAAIADLRLPAQLQERTQLWLERLRGWQPDLFRRPQTYERCSISSRATLYRDPRGRQSEKDLLVAFCGNAGRLMIPIFVFLQLLDSSRWSVLLISKSSAASYAQGLEGISDDFAGAVRQLAAKLCPREYRRIVTFGTSVGGFFAIWAAFLLNAQCGISVGGFLPRALPDTGWANPVSHIDRRLVYGAGYSRDQEQALALSRLVGGQLHPVAGVAEHNVLGALMKQRRLGKIFDDLLPNGLSRE